MAVYFPDHRGIRERLDYLLEIRFFDDEAA
jgi:hypothetical protein